MVKMVLQMTVIIIFLTLFSLIKCEIKCTNVQNSYKYYLGTKTPYRIIAGQNATAIKYPGCEARKIWAVIRHGTRNPSIEQIDKMSARLPEIRDLILENLQQATDQIHNIDIDLFKKWSIKLKQTDNKKLTHEGEDEMLLLAERMQIRFPGLIRNVYSESEHEFKYTATQRTKKSAQYFVAGLFGRNTVKDVYFPEPLKRDPILRFYKLCNKWRKEVKKNPKSIAERKKFDSGIIMSETIKEVNERLGFEDELNLSDIRTIYTTCAFETAWNKRRRSPWCSVFTPENFKVMEYAEDLKYYWVDGYGHNLTYKQACPAFNDMIEFFQNNDDGSPNSKFYFTHSGTLLKMLAHMELYRDQAPLVADGFLKNGDRKWRVSQIDAFGTNLMFVLFDCGVEKDKILTLHQEQIVGLPSCPNSDLCELEKIVKYYSDSVTACDFDEMCEN